jgi:hypothetical protein
MGRSADAVEAGNRNAQRMQQSYAVYWNEGNGARYAGRLDLEPGYALLAGRARHGARRLLRVFFADIASIQYASGRIRVERRAEPTLEIGSVDAPGALYEMADRLQASLSPA